MVIAAKLTAAAKNFLIAVSPFLVQAPNYAHACVQINCIPVWRVICVERDARNRMATPKRNSYARNHALA